MTPYRVNDPVLRRAIAAYEAGAWPAAEAACVEILRSAPDQADALQILGSIRARSGDTRAAEPFLERARAAAPGNIFILNSLGGVYAANGRYAEARATLEAALRIDNGFPWALQNLGSLMADVGERAGARRCFERALASKPDHVESIAALADLAEKENRLPDAQVLAQRALALAPDFPVARLVQAQLELRAGSHRLAEQGLRALLAQGGLRGSHEAMAHGLLGQALEGQGRYDEAFASFAAANELDRVLHGPRFAATESASTPVAIARLKAFVETADPSRWPKPAADGLGSPVFLVGFPRSGTTLLEQVLASHPDIVALEEQDNFTDAFSSLLLAPGALHRWVDVPQSELAELRRAYWRRVEKGLRHAADKRVFVDKMPLNLAILPLIHLLFPEARYILALRDPRDVIVSCFRSRFSLNAAMFQFVSLETAARYYDTVMALADAARRKLPLALHVVRYEDLTADLRGVATSLLEFLGLPWSDAVLKYAEVASRRPIRTPSATQVIRPIYRTSISQWRHYEVQLAPVLPILDPWVREFGYDAGH